VDKASAAAADNAVLHASVDAFFACRTWVSAAQSIGDRTLGVIEAGEEDAVVCGQKFARGLRHRLQLAPVK
jgi:hypothetical protein